MTITPLLRRSLPLACLGLSLPACAQVNADVAASIRLFHTITTAVPQPLALGALSLPAMRAGDTTLVLTAGGNAWTTLPANVHSITAPTPARVTFTGTPGQTVQVDVPGSFDLTGGGTNRLAFAPQLSASTVALDVSSGEGAVSIGGTLTIPAAAGLGLTYRGTFQCTVNYQ